MPRVFLSSNGTQSKSKVMTRDKKYYLYWAITFIPILRALCVPSFCYISFIWTVIWVNETWISNVQLIVQTLVITKYASVMWYYNLICVNAFHCKTLIFNLEIDLVIWIHIFSFILRNKVCHLKFISGKTI